MGRISALADSEFAHMVADAYVKGLSREEMAYLFSVSERTITNWRQDQRVLSIAKKLHEERLMEMTRVIDAEMAGRLKGSRIKQMDDETLLKFRKELVGNVQKVELTGQLNTGSAVGDAWKALDDDPELAAKVAGLVMGMPEEPQE